MSEMVERVARALYNSVRGQDVPWELIGPTPQAMFREDARAAIEAMRCPPSSLLGIGYVGKCEAGHTSSDCWNAMIDEALK